MTEFARRDFDADREILQRQLQHTWDHLDKGKSEYLAGIGQGGQVMTAGYAMWVLENEPRDTEDRVFRLRTLSYLDAEQVAVQTDIDALLAEQQADGGWSQTDELTSDAYATGTALTALQDVGRLPGDHPAIVSGCRYLLNTRLDGDGTWHVVTHAKPIQTYYESGFPHGADQFISSTATAWATLALAGTLPEPKAALKPELIDVRQVPD